MLNPATWAHVDRCRTCRQQNIPNWARVYAAYHEEEAPIAQGETVSTHYIAYYKCAAHHVWKTYWANNMRQPPGDALEAMSH